MLTFTRHNNIDVVLIQLIKTSKININSDAIIAELEKHPDYPSLLAINDVLNSFHVKNGAFRVQADELSNVPVPFIAHTQHNGGDFVLVDKIENDLLLYSNEKGNRQKTTLTAFKRIFSGIILTAEPGLKGNQFKHGKSILDRFRNSLITAGLLSAFIMSLTLHTGYFINYTWQILLLTVFKTAGLITSVLLLIQSVDSNNPLIQKLCQSRSNTNCSDILSSKAAQVFDGLTWSEVGFFYFTGTWMILLFGGHSAVIMLTLAILNILSLPYTFYSIYYQVRIAKQWCVLCCTVQALLWLEFIPSITVFSKPITMPDTVVWSTLLISFLLPVALWGLVKPLLLKAQQVKPLKDQLRKFKYNSELFNSMLNNQPKYALPSEDWSIVLGSTKASTSITMVTNPYCPPCSKTHKILDELLTQRTDIQARIVFVGSNTNENQKSDVSRHLMALNQLEDKEIIKKALHDWYEQKQKDYKAWAKIYPVELNETEYYKLDSQKTWCEMAEVTATPTLLLNGYRLPNLYQLSDLKYML